METLRKRRTIKGFTFKLNGNCYECRGARYYDDDHDQVPEPKLQEAGKELAKQLTSEGYEVFVEHGEKGWLEIYIEDEKKV